MNLYYDLLAPGGVLFGDDYGWSGVEHDVNLFLEQRNHGKNPDDMFTFRLLRADPEGRSGVTLWIIQKAKYG